MAGRNDFLFKRETTWGTWVAPDKALSVTDASGGPTQPRIVNDDTGPAGRGRQPAPLGEKTVAMPVNTHLYVKTLGHLLRSTCGTRASAAAGAGFRTKMLPNDDVAFDSFSVQKRYGASQAESQRGLKINGYTITARSRELVTVALDTVAKDVASVGGTWADGSAAPASISPTGLYATPMPDALRFTNGVLRLGGSLALTAGEIVVTGGTDRCEMDNVSVQFAFNIPTDAFGFCLDDATVQDLPEGARDITLRFEPNFNIVGHEFFNAWMGGVDAVAELYFEGPEYEATFPYIYKWTLPKVQYDQAQNPPVNRSYGLKRFPVQALAVVEPTVTNVDFGLVIQSTEDYTT